MLLSETINVNAHTDVVYINIILFITITIIINILELQKYICFAVKETSKRITNCEKKEYELNQEIIVNYICKSCAAL